MESKIRRDDKIIRDRREKVNLQAKQMNQILKYTNIASLYMLSWCLFTYKRSLGIPDRIAAYSLLLCLLLSIFFIIKLYKEYALPTYMHALTILVLMFTFYGLVQGLFGDTLYVREGKDKMVAKFAYLSTIYISLFPIYGCYYLTKKGFITTDFLRIWGVILFLLILIEYRYYETRMLAKGINNFHNNYGYHFVALIPMLVLYNKNKIVQMLAISIVLMLIVYSAKRGAMIIGIFAMLILLLHVWKQSDYQLRFVLVFFVFCLTFYVVYEIYQNPYFVKNIQRLLQEGGQNGRSIIKSQLLPTFYNIYSPMQKVFGDGAYASLRYAMNYAHNDWLEIMIGQGLFGICIYSFYWLCFGLEVFQWRNVSNANHLYVVLQLVFTIYFIKTLFSMSYSSMPLAATSVFAFALAKLDEAAICGYLET